MKKPAQTPTCPTGLPQHKKDYSTKQNKAVILWLAFLPLMELRKRQLICSQQVTWAYGRYNKGERTDNLLMAIDNLSVTEKHLDVAIDLRIFEWELERPTGELALIPSQWSEKFMRECMRFTIPHNGNTPPL